MGGLVGLRVGMGRWEGGKMGGWESGKVGGR